MVSGEFARVHRRQMSRASPPRNGASWGKASHEVYHRSRRPAFCESTPCGARYSVLCLAGNATPVTNSARGGA
jgi:hypothetical protein